MSHARYNGSENLSTDGMNTADSEDSGLSTDDIFTVLSNSRRRHAIRVVMEHERIDFRELVDRVAELEYGLPIDEISSDERHTIYVSLQQTHKGRLEDEGIIESDRDTGSISLGHNAEEIAEYLSKIDENPTPDSLRGKVASLF